MAHLYNHRLLFRLTTLVVLAVCLGVLSRTNANLTSPSKKALPNFEAQAQKPTVTVQSQSEAPLRITLVGSSSSPEGEFGFYTLNLSSKPIRAFAIKQDIRSEVSQSSVISLHNLDITKGALAINQSELVFDTYPLTSEKIADIILSVDYVEFGDGSKWGADTGRSSERSAGQRAAARAVSKRLLEATRAGNVDKVIHSLDSSGAMIEVPGLHSA